MWIGENESAKYWLGVLNEIMNRGVKDIMIVSVDGLTGFVDAICEIKRRTRAISAFPDGQSALMLVCVRLRHVAGTQWGAKRYMNMDHLAELDIQNDADNIVD